MGHFLKARAECQLNVYKKIEESYERNSEEGKEIDTAFKYLYEGRNFYCKHQYNSAVNSYKKAIMHDPELIHTEYMPLCLIGLCYWRERKLDKALKWLNKAIEARPECPVSFCNKGNVLSMLSREVEALACFEKAIQLRPKYHIALTSKAKTLDILGRKIEALESLDLAIKLDPNDPENPQTERLRTVLLAKMTATERDSYHNKLLTKAESTGLEYKFKIESLLSLDKHDEAKKVYKDGLKKEKNMFDQWPEIKNKFPTVYVS